MMLFLWTASLGWFAVLLLAATVCIPYIARIKMPAPDVPRPRGMPLHFWAGPTALVIAFAHAWLPMSAGVARQGLVGIWMATFALLVMGWQVALGLRLRSASPTHRGTRRRLHFWTMCTIVVLVLAHIAINRVA
jgi:hypothetical protein